MPKGKSSGQSRGKGKAKRKAATPPPPTPTEPEDTEATEAEPTEAAPEATEEDLRADTPSSVGSVSSEKKKSKGKSRKSCRLQSEEQESDVLEWVAENPCLWNQKNKDYKNKGKKDRLWQEKADEIGIDGEYFFFINVLYLLFRGRLQ